MSKLESYRNLEVWKQTKGLVCLIYQVTKAFPKEEQFGITNQLRRASVSIPSNIAEGCGRNHSKDSIQFFFISRGSLYEVETQIIIPLISVISQLNITIQSLTISNRASVC